MNECITTTTTTVPCFVPFPPADLEALIPNPDEMTPCEEIVKGLIRYRQKVLQFFKWFLTANGDLSPAFRCVVCGLDCAGVNLDGARFEMPCTSTPSSAICPCDDPADQIKTISGDPNVIYNVTLRFRGLVEGKTYIGGTNDGEWWQVGGTPLDPDLGGYNIYALVIDDPAVTYYLNRSNPGHTGPPYVYAIDYTKTVQIRGGSIVTLHAEAVDGQEISNHTGVVVPGVAPYPAAFAGQFIQIDVVSITPP